LSLLINQQIVYMKASTSNWNPSKLVGHIKMMTLHVTRHIHTTILLTWHSKDGQSVLVNIAFFIRPSLTKICSEGCKNNTCESKNLEILSVRSEQQKCSTNCNAVPSAWAQYYRHNCSKAFINFLNSSHHVIYKATVLQFRTFFMKLKAYYLIVCSGEFYQKAYCFKS
jgi:hypothetical protein